MDIETYFAPAIKMGKLVQAYYQSEGEEKKNLALEIGQSPYIAKVREIQSIWVNSF